jgi:hypothetical protein
MEVAQSDISSHATTLYCPWTALQLQSSYNGLSLENLITFAFFWR